MTAFKEIKIGNYFLRFWPSDNGWMCGITPQMMEALEQPAPVQDTEAHYKAVVEGVQKLFNDKRTQPAPVQEPVAWMEMVVANLVREGVNKHKARELAQHFYTPPQRTWVGLTDKELEEFSDADLGSYDLCLEVEARLKERNT